MHVLGLQHSVGFGTVVEPIRTGSYRIAVQFRFAHPEKEYRLGLHDKLIRKYGDSFSLSDSSMENTLNGGTNSRPILSLTIDCLHLRGPLNNVRSICQRSLSNSWIWLYPASSCPSQLEGVQTAVLVGLKSRERCIDPTRTI